MKAIISHIKSLKLKSWDRLMLNAIVVGIPFTVSIGNIAVISAFIYTLFTAKKRFFEQLKKYPWVLVLPLIYFFIIFISALLSNDIKTGLKLVDKSLFFLLIPIILISLSRQIDFKNVMLVFAKSTLVATAILLFYSIVTSIRTKDFDHLFFHSFTRLFDQHPVYFSIYQGLSVFIILKYKLNSPKLRRLYLVVLMVLVLGIFLSASKMVISIFCVIFIYQIFKKIKAKKTVLIMIFLGFVLLLFTIPTLKNRFIEGLEYDLKFTPTNNIAQSKVFNYEDKHLISDLEIRYIFGSIGLYHFIDDNKLLFGYGVGDVQDYLDLYYMQYGLAPNWYEDYNLHNQYLQVLISSGIFAFLFFIYYVFYILKVTLKSKNELSLIFLTIIFFVFFIESVLMRNKGVIVFVFFTSFFLIQNLQYEDSNSRHQRDS